MLFNFCFLNSDLRYSMIMPLQKLCQVVIIKTEHSKFVTETASNTIIFINMIGIYRNAIYLHTCLKKDKNGVYFDF